MRRNRLCLAVHSVILAGIVLLVIWPLHPIVISWGYTVAGSRVLQRLQRSQDLPQETRYAQATQAGQLFQTALAWDPLNHRAYANLAAVYLVWNDTTSAARALARAAILAPRTTTTDQFLEPVQGTTIP
jgi:cytochrome c-type biogenesis protein CcmH/NrfG